MADEQPQDDNGNTPLAPVADDNTPAHDHLRNMPVSNYTRLIIGVLQQCIKGALTVEMPRRTEIMMEASAASKYFRVIVMDDYSRRSVMWDLDDLVSSNLLASERVFAGVTNALEELQHHGR